MGTYFLLFPIDDLTVEFVCVCVWPHDELVIGKNDYIP